MDKLDTYIEMAIELAPKILTGIIILIIGFFVINRIVKVLRSQLEQRNFDRSVTPFLTSMLSVLLKVLLLFSIAEIVGIKTTSFVALIAAAGFAIGMALQGSLGNFASGVMILLFKPYSVGDLIEVQDEKGWVKEIQIFNTILQTVTNQNVIIPNGMATSDKVINHSSNSYIRVDLFFAIPYEEDFEKVKEAMLIELEQINKILKDPAPSVGIEAFDSHNIKCGAFLFAKPEFYWDVYYEANLAIKKGLGKNNIKMAYSEGVELGPIGKA